MMSIHADGVFLTSGAACRRMKASGKGGKSYSLDPIQTFVGSKLKAPYNFVVKHSAARLAKPIVCKGTAYGILYIICPSFIKTPLVEKQISEQAASLSITEEAVKNILLRDTVDGAFTTVEDVADTVVSLSKDRGL